MLQTHRKWLGDFSMKENLAATLLGCKTFTSTDAGKKKTLPAFTNDGILPKDNCNVLIKHWKTILADFEFRKQVIFLFFCCWKQIQSFTDTRTNLGR
jgi:hypothetical protein